jgi:hypothetical protein
MPDMVRAVELEINSSLGIDSNPFRLNDLFPAQDETFWRNDVDIGFGEASPWYLDLRVIDTQYTSNEPGDTTLFDSRLGYEGLYGESEHTFDLSVGGRSNDSTYVSRVTGDVYQVSRQDAGDRYDYYRWDVQGEFKFKLADRRSILLNLDYREQDYEDYDELGISDLDYKSFELELGWQDYWSADFRYRIYANFNRRDYDDRRARSLDGMKIPRSDSEYEVARIVFDTRYRLSRGTFLYASVRYGERKDNGGGYYDSETFSGSVRYRKQFNSNGGVFWFSLYYRDLSYDRGDFAQNIENEAEPPSSQGWRAVMSYERPVKSWAKGKLSWFANARYYDYDSGRQIYEYDRWTMETGLKYEL